MTQRHRHSGIDAFERRRVIADIEYLLSRENAFHVLAAATCPNNPRSQLLMATRISPNRSVVARKVVSASAIWRRPGIEFTPLTMVALDAAIIFGVQEYQFTGKSIMIKS